MDIVMANGISAPPPQKILVIDDEEDIRNVIVLTLKKVGYEIIEARNGLDGLSAVKMQHPDLILCDANMPKMDGSTLLGTLKEEIEFAGIPFIFLTGNTDLGDIRKGMQLGADDYLTKPFTAQDLIAAVKTRLTKNKSMEKYFKFQFEEVKTNIVRSLPHEFRTPLSGILGFSDILKMEENLPSAEVRKIGALIGKAGERLQHLLENMILFGQLELWIHDKEKTQALRTETATTLSDIIKSVAEKLMETRGRADAISISIKNCLVQISALYLTKIMDELIDNALKFSKPGAKIFISNELNDADVQITVRDEGRGMSEGQINKISSFLQFERDRYEQQGAGLGLAIAIALAKIHGGSITLESKEQIGTTVTLRLPKVQL